MKEKNNKGFTLIELLAVVVILLSISVIAISSITAAIERNKEKQNKTKQEVLVSYAKLYYDINKKNLSSSGCITLDELEAKKLASEEELKDANGDKFIGVIQYSNGSNFEYKEFGANCTGNTIDGGSTNNTIKIYEDWHPGDYVSYTPSLTAIEYGGTGTGNFQLVTPSELNVWRVLKLKTNTNKIEIISHNVSTKCISFQGKDAYRSYVGILNNMASGYETSGITVGSRHFGYDSTTTSNYLSSIASLRYPAIYTCSTGTSGCEYDEKDGGGDEGYLSDYNLVKQVLGTVGANKKDGTNGSYWVASRLYKYYSNSSYVWEPRMIYNESLGESDALYWCTNSSCSDRGDCYSLRPIVILDATKISYTGSGTSTSPWKIN